LPVIAEKKNEEKVCKINANVGKVGGNFIKFSFLIFQMD